MQNTALLSINSIFYGHKSLSGPPFWTGAFSRIPVTLSLPILPTFAEYKTEEERGAPLLIENCWSNLDMLYKILKRILRRFRFKLCIAWKGSLSVINILFRYLKNISISRLHEQSVAKWLLNSCPKNLQTLKIWTYIDNFEARDPEISNM